MRIYDAKGRKLEALPENAAQESGGNLQSLAVNQQATVELLQLILKEQQIQTTLLVEAFGLNDNDVIAMRDDPNFPV
jgi:hypothetical protein